MTSDNYNETTVSNTQLFLCFCGTNYSLRTSIGIHIYAACHMMTGYGNVLPAKYADRLAMTQSCIAVCESSV